jgi:hypothetical protein
MKKPVLWIALLCSSAIFAQTDVGEIKIDELRAPSSPAYSILGVQPTEISRPKSWREVESVIGSSFFEDNKLIIPKNLAVEFNPFFTTNRTNPQLSPSYVYGNDSKDFVTVFKSNSAFSVATGNFKTYSDTSKMNPRMGLGYRTRFVDFKPTAKATAAYNKFLYSQVQTTNFSVAIQELTINNSNAAIAPADLNKQLKTAVKEILRSTAELADTAAFYIIIDNELQPAIDSMIAKNANTATILEQLTQIAADRMDKANVKESYQEVADGLGERYGSCLEFATSFLLDFPTNDIAFSKTPKFGMWLTYTYRTQSQNLEFGALGRFITTKFDTSTRYNNFDFGGRIMLNGGKWSMNGELIQRIQFEVVENKNPNQVTFQYSLDFKASLNVNYKLTDDVILSYTFGNNFTVNTEIENAKTNLGSSVSVVYAFGGPRVKDLQKAID